MSEALKIFLTASLTLFGGVLLFCATTILNRLVFEPVLALRKTLGDISFCVQYHAWVFSGGHETVEKERFDKVFDELRTLTARMRAEANRVCFYAIFADLRWLPPYQDLIEAAGHLIRLSNSLGSSNYDLIRQDMHAVQALLRIDVGRPKYKPQIAE